MLSWFEENIWFEIYEGKGMVIFTAILNLMYVNIQ